MHPGIHHGVTRRGRALAETWAERLYGILAHRLDVDDEVTPALRDDSVSYGDYVEQLTYLVFLKQVFHVSQIRNSTGLTH